MDKIKEKVLEYKYEIGGFICLLLFSAIYKLYYPDLNALLNDKDKVSSNISMKENNANNENKEIKKEIISLKKKLLSTEKQLLKYEDEINDKKELSMFQNSQYNFNRLNKKILTLKWTAAGGNRMTINEQLREPFKIDKLSNIYLDNFTTSYEGDGTNYPEFGHNPNISAYVLKIDQFKIDSNSNDENLYNSIIIPNEYATKPTDTTSRKTHKGKKLNYICSINPCNITELTGTITDLDGGSSMFVANGDTFIAEFIFIARDP